MANPPKLSIKKREKIAEEIKVLKGMIEGDDGGEKLVEMIAEGKIKDPVTFGWLSENNFFIKKIDHLLILRVQTRLTNQLISLH